MRRHWLALFLALFLWTEGWICIDWVLNFSVYRRMLEPLWLMQIPGSRVEIVLNPWMAYWLSVLQLHVALVLAVWSLVKLCCSPSK